MCDQQKICNCDKPAEAYTFKPKYRYDQEVWILRPGVGWVKKPVNQINFKLYRNLSGKMENIIEYGFNYDSSNSVTLDESKVLDVHPERLERLKQLQDLEHRTRLNYKLTLSGAFYSDLCLHFNQEIDKLKEGKD